MSKKTNIAWCDSTGNPWIGCTKISPGCAGCYAAELDRTRFSRTMGGGTKEKPISHWGKGAPRLRTKGFWKDAVRWNREAGELNKGIKLRERPRIFPSLCDIWDDEVPIEWLADYLKLVFDTPNLDHLILTKRPENARRLLWDVHETAGSPALPIVIPWLRGDPPANVWLGTSVEDRARKSRIDELRKIPAKIRFLSLEPLLEDLGELDLTGIHWVIVGGESGKSARHCNVEWIRSIVRQCATARVPCFVKQLGSLAAEPTKSQNYPSENTVALLDLKHPKGGDPAEWPVDLKSVRQFPT